MTRADGPPRVSDCVFVSAVSSPSSAEVINHAKMKTAIAETAQTYGIENWGAGYFSINVKGHLAVHPAEGDLRGVDVKAVVDNLIARKVKLPILLRFPQLFASQVRLPEAVRVELQAQRLRNNPCGLANSLRGLGTGVQSSLWDRLPEVRTPTLLIAGGFDQKFAAIARAVAAAHPKAQLTLVPDAGHTVHLEQPEVFDQLVLDFLHQG